MLLSRYSFILWYTSLLRLWLMLKKIKYKTPKPQNKTKISSEREEDNSLFIMHANLSVH